MPAPARPGGAPRCGAGPDRGSESRRSCCSWVSPDKARWQCQQSRVEKQGQVAGLFTTKNQQNNIIIVTWHNAARAGSWFLGEGKAQRQKRCKSPLFKCGITRRSRQFILRPEFGLSIIFGKALRLSYILRR
ncbi:hypothetical protein, partial [Franconibacter helveticus]|uniref:hypothetical protein n=1 Tax=Franconibacter helveticus TaxID=357240 RepID=UPI001F3FE209